MLSRKDKPRLLRTEEKSERTERGQREDIEKTEGGQGEDRRGQERTE